MKTNWSIAQTFLDLEAFPSKQTIFLKGQPVHGRWTRISGRIYSKVSNTILVIAGAQCGFSSIDQGYFSGNKAIPLSRHLRRVGRTIHFYKIASSKTLTRHKASFYPQQRLATRVYRQCPSGDKSAHREHSQRAAPPLCGMGNISTLKGAPPNSGRWLWWMWVINDDIFFCRSRSCLYVNHRCRVCPFLPFLLLQRGNAIYQRLSFYGPTYLAANEITLAGKFTHNDLEWLSGPNIHSYRYGIL